MKKNIDEMTAKLFTAVKTAYLRECSGLVRNNGKCQPVTVDMMAQLANGRSVDGLALADGTDMKKVIDLMPGYSCCLSSLPRIYKQVARLAGETCEKITVGGAVLNAYGLTEPVAGAAADVVEAPAAAGYISGETTRGRVYYINNNDKSVSRIMDLERINFNSELPMWIMRNNDYNFIVFQLKENIFFRANGCGVNDNYMAAIRGDYSVYDEKTIANLLANAAAIPAKQFTPDYWPNMAVVNAYQAAGMVEEAKKLLSVREEIEKQREEKKKAIQQEQERKEQERKQAEEKRLNEAAAHFMNGGTITAADVVALCDRENISINPRTRHNLLEVVTYFENNGNRAHYKTYGKRKPSLDGCFTVADSLYQLLKIKADEAENAAPAAPDFAEVLAADAAAMPLALPAITESAIIEQAAIIKAAHEALKAEAEREQASAAFAEAITAYCEELSRPEPLAWEPETIIIPFEPRPAAEVEHPRRRHRLNLRPRLSRWLHPVRWVAVAFVVCLLSGLLLGMNTSTAAADDIAAAYDLAPVTVTAEAPDTFIKDEAPRLIEDKAPTPSPVKKLAAPSPVKNMADAAKCSSQKTDTTDTPAGEKTASPMAPVADADGLTICEGTPWAYTMMNWA